MPSARWLIICLTPDVCMTKGVPVPYMIISEADLSDCESPNVSYNGRLSLNAGSLTKACKGNEAGDTGAQSGTPVTNICTPIDKSETVLINKQGALGEGDKFYMNLCNTIGKVIMLPAVSSPSDPSGLKGAEFNKAVADLLSETLKQSKGNVREAYGQLTKLRNLPGSTSAPMTPPEFGNNPVVVAAQHFLLIASYPPGRGVKIMEKLAKPVYNWLKQTPLFPPVDWALKKTGQYGDVNENNKPSEYDPAVEEWERVALRVAKKNKVGIAYTPSAAELESEMDVMKAEEEPK